MPHACCNDAGGVPMNSADSHTFLDPDGRPFDERMQGVLRVLHRRFRSQLPRIDDGILVTEVLEEAGRRTAAHEAEHGQVDDLEAFVWQVALNVARSRLARSSMRLARATLDSAASDAVLRSLHARDGTREQIERDILVQEALAHLTPQERALYFKWAWGHTSREIGQAFGITEIHVNTLIYRINQKLRERLRPAGSDGRGR
jgi:DNA-directed RNA polymerase specialized sigma24 family protein